MSDYGDRMLKMEVESKESVVVDETTVESRMKIRMKMKFLSKRK